MSASNIRVGARRKAWRELTAAQQAQAGRLVLAVLAGAAGGQPSVVADALEQAGQMSAALEEHVKWAVGYLLGPLSLTVDPDMRWWRFVDEGVQMRSSQLEEVWKLKQEGLL